MSKLVLVGFALLLLLANKCHPRISDPVEIDSVIKIIPFGWPVKQHPVLGRPRFRSHTLFVVKSGNDVHSILKGRVIQSNYSSGYGHSVLVESFDTIRIRYFHLSECLVDSGDKVKSGQIVGKSGSSGLTSGPALGVWLGFRKKPMNLCRFMDCSKYKKDTSNARPKSCVGPFR